LKAGLNSVMGAPSNCHMVWNCAM